MSKIESLLHKLRNGQKVTAHEIGAAEAESGLLQALAGHVGASIDKDNDGGPEDWEHWNTIAKKIVEAFQESIK